MERCPCNDKAGHEIIGIAISVTRIVGIRDRRCSNFLRGSRAKPKESTKHARIGVREIGGHRNLLGTEKVMKSGHWGIQQKGTASIQLHFPHPPLAFLPFQDKKDASSPQSPCCPSPTIYLIAILSNKGACSRERKVYFALGSSGAPHVSCPPENFPGSSTITSSVRPGPAKGSPRYLRRR